MGIHTLLIQAGAPADEYDDEAAQIATAVSLLSHDETTEETIVAIISLVWMKSFELAADELKQRWPPFSTLAMLLNCPKNGGHLYPHPQSIILKILKTISSAFSEAPHSGYFFTPIKNGSASGL